MISSISSMVGKTLRPRPTKEICYWSARRAALTSYRNPPVRLTSTTLLEGHLMKTSRRAFLSDVGSGMFVATLGPALATEMGLGQAALADEPGASISFGSLDPLVEIMQSTAPAALMPI